MNRKRPSLNYNQLLPSNRRLLTQASQNRLVAEEVERVNPDLVSRDEQGKPYTVRYDAVNAMLLNEFLKQHRKVEEQSREINEQKKTITQLQSTITEQQESFDSSLAE